MAAKLDRVEREFIFKSAVESAVPFILHAPGRTGTARLSGFGHDNLSLQPLAEPGPAFRAGESVNVLFDLHGQDFAFGATVWKSAPRSIELRGPESLYRCLERHWPRVPEPAGLKAEILVPDFGPGEDFPRCEECREIEKPEAGHGLDASSLDRLVESFKAAASVLATTSRVRMLRPGQRPENPAEAIAARLGRQLFVPSTWGSHSLPLSDPWGDGRIITAEMAESFEGIAALDGSSALSAWIGQRLDEGLNSFVISPVVYYRSIIAFVQLGNGPERPRSLDLEAVDLAWAFSRHLAWFLRHHGYFKQTEGPRREKAKVLDASPGGVQVMLGPEAPLLHTGARFDLRLHFPKGSLPCKARVTRRVDGEGRTRYGLQLEGLPSSTVEALALGFYGRDETPRDTGKKV